jgi:hypothetical protein
MAIDQTRADRLARTLKRLGFHLSRTGRRFCIFDNTGQLAPGSRTGMSMTEIERWIGEFIKPGRQA